MASYQQRRLPGTPLTPVAGIFTMQSLACTMTQAAEDTIRAAPANGTNMMQHLGSTMNGKALVAELRSMRVHNWIL